MKTTYTYNFNRAIIIIGILLLIISFAVNGQTRSGNREKSQYRTRETKVVRNENPKNQRTTLRYTRDDNRNNNPKNKIVKYESVNNKQGKNKGGNKNGNYQKHNNYNKHANYNHSYAHGKKYYKKHYYNNYYHTSPWAYNNYPAVFYHKNYGEYYFHSGRFYSYHWKYGYRRVDIPAHVVFSTIPQGYSRVYINGRLHYRFGDVYFKHTPHGYRVAHQRPGIHFSASF